MAHAPYNPSGGNTWRKKLRKKLSPGPKTKPGYRLLPPWKCPNPELHSHMETGNY